MKKQPRASVPREPSDRVALPCCNPIRHGVATIVDRMLAPS